MSLSQSYFTIPKNIRLNSTHYFIMKIPNKIERQKIAFNHSSDIDFKDFMNLYKKKCTTKPFYFLVADATLARDNPSRFRKNLSKIIRKLFMAIDYTIWVEKLQCDVNRKTRNISALSSGKIESLISE